MVGYYNYLEQFGHPPTNTTAEEDIYSPVTLNQDSSKLLRLILVGLFLAFSGYMNILFVASFFIEKTLKQIGNIFLACAGGCDLLITLGILPSVFTVLLSDHWDTFEVCNFVHFLGQWACYGYSISFMMIGIECFLRTCRSRRPYEIFRKLRMDIIALVYMSFSGILAGYGVFENMDYDYCNRASEGDLTFRYWTMITCHVIPCCIAFITLFISIRRIQRRYNTDSAYKRSEQYVLDSVTTNMNIFMLIFYVVFWLPYVVIVYFRTTVSDTRFYISAWLGLGRTALTSPTYGLVGSNFRRAYRHLMNYCCCKTPIPEGGYHYRGRINREYMGPGEIRVHMLQPPLRSQHRHAIVQETNGL